MRVELNGHLRFAEKTPTNALLIPFLSRAFPGSQFLHIVRDGRDVALSVLRKPWFLASSRGWPIREPGGYLYGPYARWWVEPQRRAEFEATTDVHRAIWSWRRYTEAALRDGPALGSARYLEVRFEDLLDNPAREAERILAFLAIGRATSRDKFLAATARPDTGVVGRWRETLSTDDLAVIDTEAGDLLRGLGYAD